MFNQIEELLAVEKAKLRHGLSRSLLGAALALLAVLAALEGFAIVLAGGYVSLSRTLAPWAAGLIVGGIIILAALLMLALVIHALRQPDESLRRAVAHRHRAREPEAAAANAPSLLGAAAAELVGKANIKARDIALLALVAGVALGVSPRLRQHVFGHKPRSGA